MHCSWRKSGEGPELPMGETGEELLRGLWERVVGKSSGKFDFTCDTKIPVHSSICIKM